MRLWQMAVGLAISVILGSACRPAPVEVAALPTQTARPPAIPTHMPITYTPSVTPTATLSPTPTFTPSATFTSTPTNTATFTPTSTPTQTFTPVPPRDDQATAAEISEGEPLPTATATIVPAPTDDPADVEEPFIELPAQYTLHLSGVGSNLREVYLRGQQLGRNRTHFSKIGDCHSTSKVFLQPVDRGGYVLGDYAYLEKSIRHFRGSYAHVGPAALDGMHMDTLLDPMWADPKECQSGESRVDCEIRVHNPSIALIFIQPHLTSTGTWRDLFYTSLKTGVETLLENGVIPVLATQIEWRDHPIITSETNRIIRQVAEEYGIPLWDFHAATVDLSRPADRGNWHLSTSPYGSLDFTNPKNMEYAMTLRNLEAMQVLHYLLEQVIDRDGGSIN